jgi:hypothetical protein
MTAFEKLYDFTDKLAERFKKTDNVKVKMEIIYILIDYYETVLSHGKFVSQRHYCKKMIFELEPNFAIGYFKKQ